LNNRKYGISEKEIAVMGWTNSDVYHLIHHHSSTKRQGSKSETGSN
jgi:hypothetical protein